MKNDTVGRNWKTTQKWHSYFDTDFKVQNNLHFFYNTKSVSDPTVRIILKYNFMLPHFLIMLLHRKTFQMAI